MALFQPTIVRTNRESANRAGVSAAERSKFRWVAIACEHVVWRLKPRRIQKSERENIVTNSDVLWFSGNLNSASTGTWLTETEFEFEIVKQSYMHFYGTRKLGFYWN